MNAASWKPRLLADELLRELARVHGTPLYVYDARVVRARLSDLAGFEVVRYAQKANGALGLLDLLRRQGALVDAVSAGELLRARAAGFAPEQVAFTADLFDRAALEHVAREPYALNLGSPDMLEQLAAVRPGAEFAVRVNPGFGHGHARKVNTGGEESKHGVWHEDLTTLLARAERLGLVATGLHVHIGSGSDFEHLGRVRAAVRSLATLCPPSVRTLSAGGGLPIPYRAGAKPFDSARYGAEWRATRDELARSLGRPLELECEPGRYLVAECGMLLCEVRGTKRSGRVDYVLVDAGFHNLLRPAMYGAYHQISIIGRDHEPRAPRVVAGPLCESADVFTQGEGGRLEAQLLPRAQPGDLLCIHDAGAYGQSMASNYNSQPFAAEVLVDLAGNARLIRRRQELTDLWRDELL